MYDIRVFEVFLNSSGEQSLDNEIYDKVWDISTEVGESDRFYPCGAVFELLLVR
jgi:hypothetical protein